MVLRTVLKWGAGFTACAIAAAYAPAPGVIAQEPAPASWVGFVDHVSASPGGAAPSAMAESAARGLSADGRFAVVQSAAADLVDDDGNGVEDVFVRDRATGTLTRVSVADDGREGDRPSVAGSISADGRHVAFASLATTLAPGAAGTRLQVYVRDLVRARTVRVTVSPAGSEGNGDSTVPVLSADGRLVAFVSSATNLVGGATAARPAQAYVHDRDADGNGIFDEPGAVSTTRASLTPSGGFADADVDHVRISADGRVVLFETAATNILPAASNAMRHAFVHDRLQRSTELVDRTPDGGAAAYGVAYRTADLSDDGRYVSFASYSPDIVPAELTFVSQAFRADRVTGEIVPLTVAADGAAGDGPTYSTSISADGRFVAMMTTALNLAGAGAADTGAIAVRDVAAGTFSRVDVTAEGQPISHYYPYNVMLSADATAVAFTSDAGYGIRQGTASNGLNAFVATRFAVTPRTVEVASGGGAVALDVLTPAATGWTAASGETWLTISDGAGFGAGRRTVRVSVEPNRTGGARTGSLTLGLTPVTVHQAWDPDVSPVTPVLTWSSPAAIGYGTALGPQQLNAVADTDGTYAYAPAAGTVLPAGTHTLTVTFTPADDRKFTSATVTTTIVVERAVPALSWGTPAPLVYGGALGAAQLNATADVPGRFDYTPGPGALLHAGTHPVGVTFTPADAHNYASVSASREVTVYRAAVVVRPADAVKPYGAPLPAFTASAEGLVNGDAFAVLRGTPVFATSADDASPVGTYRITVSGLESADYTVSYAPGTLTIVPAPTVVAVTSHPSPVTWNQPVTITATVGAVSAEVGVPTGFVEFYDGTSMLGSAPVESGKAVLSTHVLTQGDHTITAAYSGDANFEASAGSVHQAVDMPDGSVRIVLSTSASPSQYGRAVTFAAAVSAASATVTGDVDFYDGARLIRSVPLVNGIARLTVRTLAEGGHAIHAQYRGNGTNVPSVSPVIAQHVRDRGPANRIPRVRVRAVYGSGSGPLLVSATVEGHHREAPRGRVLFLVNGIVIGEVAGALAGSTLHAQQEATAGLAPGTYTVTAVYLGSWRYRATVGVTTLTVE